MQCQTGHKCFWQRSKIAIEQRSVCAVHSRELRLARSLPTVGGLAKRREAPEGAGAVACEK
jgi:hypothetical protein